MSDSQETLDGLKRKIDKLTGEIQDRIEQFNQNRAKIDALMEGAELGAALLNNLSQFTAENQRILSDNERALYLQGVLISLFTSEAEKLRETPGNSSCNSEELFQLTIQGKLPFDEGYPLLNDEIFLKRLLDYWESKEEFEKCQIVFEYLQQSSQQAFA